MTAVWNAIIAFFEKIGLIFDPTTAPAFENGGAEKFYVSFEGLGIKWFRVNPVAFSIPKFTDVRWYGILITIGIVLAFLYVAKWRAKDAGYHFDDVIDFVLFTVPIGVIGARLFYVFTYPGFNLARDWYKIWEGGLAIYGGIIFGIAAIIGVALYKKVRILRLLDCTAPAVMIAQAIGRWGNFFNGEAFGANTGTFFLRMGLSMDPSTEAVYHVHPTFLYESLWNIIGFALINVFYKKKKFDGQITLEYIGWYGLGRFFIELLRQDSLPLKLGKYNFRISAVIGLLCFVVCLVLFLVFVFKPKSPLLDLPCYYPGAKRLKLMEAEAAKKAAAAESGCAPAAPDEKPADETGELPEEAGELPEEAPSAPDEAAAAAEEAPAPPAEAPDGGDA